MLKGKTKKGLALFLFVLMVLAMMPVSAFAVKTADGVSLDVFGNPTDTKRATGEFRQSSLLPALAQRSITIEKRAKDGANIPADEEFYFEIEFNREPIAVPGGAELLIEREEYYNYGFSLKIGQSIAFTVEQGTNYTASETELSEKYKAPLIDGVEVSYGSVSGVACTDDIVHVFTNDVYPETKMLNVTIDKKVAFAAGIDDPRTITDWYASLTHEGAVEVYYKITVFKDQPIAVFGMISDILNGGNELPQLENRDFSMSAGVNSVVFYTKAVSLPSGAATHINVAKVVSAAAENGYQVTIGEKSDAKVTVTVPGTNPPTSATYTVTVNYYNKDTGETMTVSYTTSGSAGSPYNVSGEANRYFAGFILDSMTGDAISGTLDTNKVINVYYTTAVEEEPINDPTTPLDEPPIIVPPHEEEQFDDGETPKDDLPPTGGSMVGLFGLFGLGLLAGGMFLKKNKKQDEDDSAN